MYEKWIENSHIFQQLLFKIPISNDCNFQLCKCMNLSVTVKKKNTVLLKCGAGNLLGKYSVSNGIIYIFHLLCFLWSDLKWLNLWAFGNGLLCLMALPPSGLIPQSGIYQRARSSAALVDYGRAFWYRGALKHKVERFSFTGACWRIYGANMWCAFKEENAELNMMILWVVSVEAMLKIILKHLSTGMH